MRPLAWSGLWLTVGWLLVIAVIALTLWPSPVGAIPPALKDKTGHVIAYFVLMLWFAGLYPRPRHLAIGVAFFVLGVGLEWLQGFIEIRVSEVLDMAANAGGAVLGWVAARLGLDAWCAQIERLLGASA